MLTCLLNQLAVPSLFSMKAISGISSRTIRSSVSFKTVCPLLSSSVPAVNAHSSSPTSPLDMGCPATAAGVAPIRSTACGGASAARACVLGRPGPSKST